MTSTDMRVPPVAGRAGFLDVQWGPVVAGAIAAAALAFVLHSFGVAIGISVSSTAPTWRDASFALILLSGLYLILVALAAYAFGGYVAGRMREPLAGVTSDRLYEADFSDGMHGLLVWALATLLTGLMAFVLVQALPRLAAPSGGSASSVAGENIIAYDLDRLFRAEKRPVAQPIPEQTRSEAARILLTASSHNGMQPDDRAYLVRLVASATGLPEAEASRRVDEVTARAKQNIDRARRAGVVLGFMAGAAALIGAAAAWFAAVSAGRHRDGREALPDLFDWGKPMGRPRLTL